MKYIHLLTILFLTAPLHATMERHYQEGNTFSNQQSFTKPNNPGAIPGFQSDSPPETQLKSSNLGDLALQRLKSSEAGSALLESSDKRPRFTFDVSREPLFTQADPIINDPLKTITEGQTQILEKEELGESEIKTCEEAGDPTLYTCLQTRIIEFVEAPLKTHRVTAHLYSHGWGGGLSKNIITGQKLDSTVSNQPWYAAGINLTNPFDPSLKDRVVSIKYVNPQGNIKLSKEGVLSVPTGGSRGWIFINHTDAHIDIEYRPLPQVSDIIDTVDNGCSAFEDKCDQGLCELMREDITQSGQTRTLQGFAITHPWWQKQLTFSCTHPSKNDCAVLRARHCHQINSTCKEKVENTCVVWTQTYECTKTRRAKQTTVTATDLPFCLDGKCNTASWEANTDMAEVISKLSIFKELQKSMDVTSATAFKGDAYHCTRNCLNFKDCCKTGKGWGVSLHLASCKESEKALAELRASKRCVYVGTFCDKKKLKKCIRKKSGFCCFGTKLARILHEQGRAQLRVNFGSAEAPNCRGLTIEEISKLNFDQLNLYELYSDIVSAYKAPNISKLTQEFMQDFKARLPKEKPLDNQPRMQKLKEGEDVAF